MPINFSLLLLSFHPHYFILLCLSFAVSSPTSSPLPPSPLPPPNSAGVGRTGSLISIDVEMQRAQKEGVVDPFNFVLQMRQQRNQMVQTEVSRSVLVH